MSVAGDESPRTGTRMQPASPSTESDSSSTSGDDVVGDTVAEAPRWPDELCGMPLKFVKGRKDAKWHYHDRLGVQCNNKLHIGCSRSRSVQMDTAEYGPMAPLIFLAAWLAKSDVPAEQHWNYRPKQAEMQAAQEFLRGK